MFLARDVNGNKILKLEKSDLSGKRGFSIQTNGNLPQTHKMETETFDRAVAVAEIKDFVSRYGTISQKHAVYKLK